jgi:hypothetical protein
VETLEAEPTQIMAEEIQVAMMEAETPEVVILEVTRIPMMGTPEVELIPATVVILVEEQIQGILTEVILVEEQIQGILTEAILEVELIPEIQAGVTPEVEQILEIQVGVTLAVEQIQVTQVGVIPVAETNLIQI